MNLRSTTWRAITGATACLDVDNARRGAWLTLSREPDQRAVLNRVHVRFSKRVNSSDLARKGTSFARTSADG
jgi:hypothetical protein